jgi:pyrimidine-nucleoside phosphorylase
MVDLIEKKKQNKILSKEELHFIIDGYVKGTIPDYQMSAFMMAICFTGLSKEETADLTMEMMHSGEVIDLSKIAGIKVDKHSTGGVGDKISLVLGPMVAACGVKMAKMSGRGLGHTGGTLDKLESIPGLTIQIENEDFIKQVNSIGIAIIGQTASLVPADKKMYALRDVTATVSCVPLIASSIMSKKLASGSDAILLDVKYGEGAFMKTKEEAKTLARMMIDISKHLGKDTRATISNMNQPLGNAIGNSLEVIEAIHTLQGKGPSDVLELCLQAGSHMLVQAKRVATLEEARILLEAVIENGKALDKLRQMVEAQHGNGNYITNPTLFKKATYSIAVPAQATGYIEEMEADMLGIVSMKLGGGRLTTDDIIDHSAGITLTKKIGDYVEKEEPIAYIYANKEVSQELITELLSAYTIVETKVKKPVLIEEILV